MFKQRRWPPSAAACRACQWHRLWDNQGLASGEQRPQNLAEPVWRSPMKTSSVPSSSNLWVFASDWDRSSEAAINRQDDDLSLIGLVWVWGGQKVDQKLLFFFIEWVDETYATTTEVNAGHFEVPQKFAISKITWSREVSSKPLILRFLVQIQTKKTF